MVKEMLDGVIETQIANALKEIVTGENYLW